MAANPPFGAYIDYALARDAKGPLVVEIHDAAGGLVRRFSSNDQITPPDLAHIDTAPEWIRSDPPPSNLAGGHRLVWDLHYAAPAGLGDGSRVGGVWAPPGVYRVTLTIDGASFTQPLALDPDPRVKSPPSSYALEFTLAREIEADQVRVHAALMEIAAAGKSLAAATPLRPDMATAAAALTSPESPTSLAAIADTLAKLETAVDDADGGPSADAKQGYVLASKALTETVARWDALKAELATQQAK